MILESHLRISECTIPEPLVPFFQALAAINGPFVCMGDIVLFMMELPSIWSPTGFHPTANVARQLPIPAIILDQLYALTRFANDDPATPTYPTFNWYRNVFGLDINSVALVGRPVPHPRTRNWIYPTAEVIEPFPTTRFAPRHEIPSEMSVIFSHSYHELEERSEQFATLTYVNVDWSDNIEVQNKHTAINCALTHQGHYWLMTPFRFSPPVSLKYQFAPVIASRYHQQTANRVDYINLTS